MALEVPRRRVAAGCRSLPGWASDLEAGMSMGELLRLVEEAEADAVLRRSLGHCRSPAELVLASRRLGYRIDRRDLLSARSLDREPPRPLDPRPGRVSDGWPVPAQRSDGRAAG